MPLQKLEFRPGLNREGTDYANEGGWYDGDKVRFRSGFPEKIGGWSRLSNETYLGVARSLWNWQALDGSNYLGVGTNVKYYIEKGGEYYDITPFSTINSLSGAFAAVNGSSTITVTDTTAGAPARSVGDYVVFSGAASLGGNITAVVLNQEYIITSVPSTTTYTITAKSPITGLPVSATASDSGTGGAAIVASYEVPVGLNEYTVGTGWGTGPWSPYTPVTLGTNPLAFVNNSGTITVTHNSHGLITGNYVVLTGATTSRGIPAVDLNATFEITYINANSYSIKTAGMLPDNSDAGTIVKATSTGTGGGSTVVVIPQSGIRGWGEEYIGVGIGSQLRLWSADNFGQDLVLAPRGGDLYYWIAASGVTTRAVKLSSLASSAVVDPAYPTYTYQDYVPTQTNLVVSSAIQKFVIAMGANSYVPGDPNTDFNPMLVRWSDQLNAFNWVPDITNQSGEFALTNGSYIMTAKATRQEILVWTDSAIYSMQYLGAPYIWGFQVLMDNISIISPNAAITINNVTYWMGTDKFYMYSGRVETLPCALRQYVFNDINKNQGYQVFAGANEGYNEVWWFYPSVSGTDGTGTDANPNTIVDKYVIYNYVDRVWYYGSMERSAWLDSGIREYPMAAAYNNRILYHESSVDDNAGESTLPIVSYVQSSDFDIGDGHNFGFVWRILPDVNFNGSDVNNPSITMTVKPRVNSGAAYSAANNPRVTSSDAYGESQVFNIQEFTGQVYTRLRGRQLAFRIESTGVGVAWQLGCPRIDIRPDGRR
jgi:hypothetical protein